MIQNSFDFFESAEAGILINAHKLSEFGIFSEFEEVVILGSPTVKILLSFDGACWYFGVHVMLEDQGAAFNPRVTSSNKFATRSAALKSGIKRVSQICISAGTKRAKEVLELLKLVR